MGDSITPEQAIEAVKSAGLDVDRPLSEQLPEPAAAPSESAVRGWVSEAVAEAQPPTPEQQAQRFAEGFRDALVEAQSPWFSFGGTDAA